MPNQSLEEPITKVTLNLFEADVKWLKRHIGEGWSTYTRTIVHDWVRRQKNIRDERPANA